VDRAEHLAAIGGDDIAGVLFQCIAEGVIVCQEEPGVAAPAGRSLQRPPSIVISFIASDDWKENLMSA